MESMEGDGSEYVRVPPNPKIKFTTQGGSAPQRENPPVSTEQPVQHELAGETGRTIKCKFRNRDFKVTLKPNQEGGYDALDDAALLEISRLCFSLAIARAAYHSYVHLMQTRSKYAEYINKLVSLRDNTAGPSIKTAVNHARLPIFHGEANAKAEMQAEINSIVERLKSFGITYVSQSTSQERLDDEFGYNLLDQ